MAGKKVLVLGGYGGVGKALCRLILKRTDSDVIIAGRRGGKAEEYARALYAGFPGRGVEAREVDASDSASLNKGFAGVDLVIAAATTPEHVRRVAVAALGAGADYIDILVQREAFAAVKEIEGEILRAGRRFIAQAGFHPGLPAAFIREAAQYFDRYDSALVGMKMNARFDKPESAQEILKEVAEFDVDIFDKGAWRKATYKDSKRFDFGPRFGVQACFPLHMEEIKAMPGMFGLRETGVYVAGFNWFVDNIVFGLVMAADKIKKGLCGKSLARLFHFGVNRFSPAAQGIVFMLSASGEKDGKPVRAIISAEHDDPVYFTAAAVVACLLQYLDGTLKGPGVGMMGQLIDPARAIGDMKDMGIAVTTEVKTV